MRPLLAILCLLLAGCSTVTDAERVRAQYPNGYSSTLTHSRSAEPVFYGDDVVWVDTATPYEALTVGMWVIAWPPGYPMPVGPHVIIGREGPLFKTKGINSPAPDYYMLSPTNYLGTVRFGWRNGQVVDVPGARR